MPGELTQVDTAAELFGLCAVVEMVKARQDAADAGDLLALRRRGESLLSRLIATQQKDGGWPWAGARDSDVRTSAVVVARPPRCASAWSGCPESGNLSASLSAAPASATGSPGGGGRSTTEPSGASTTTTRLPESRGSFTEWIDRGGGPRAGSRGVARTARRAGS